jgi:predicted RNA binding protein YcfA (HicA-like mRNA interferase family)
MSSKGHTEGGRKELIAELYKDGWVFLKQKGDHLHFVHPKKKGKVTVPWKITKNIQLSVYRQAGIGKNGRKYYEARYGKDCNEGK